MVQSRSIISKNRFIETSIYGSENPFTWFLGLQAFASMLGQVLVVSRSMESKMSKQRFPPMYSLGPVRCSRSILGNALPSDGQC
jgi:hypothetical protein